MSTAPRVHGEIIADQGHARNGSILLDIGVRLGTIRSRRIVRAIADESRVAAIVTGSAVTAGNAAQEALLSLAVVDRDILFDGIVEPSDVDAVAVIISAVVESDVGVRRPLLDAHHHGVVGVGSPASGRRIADDGQPVSVGRQLDGDAGAEAPLRDLVVGDHAVRGRDIHAASRQGVDGDAAVGRRQRRGDENGLILLSCAADR